MYLDHRVTAKITQILEQIDMSALLMDNNGTVVLPEGDNRQLSLPDQLRRDPTTPMVYGGVTLIGTDGPPAPVHLPARRFAGSEELRHTLCRADQHAGARRPSATPRANRPCA